MSSFAAMNFNSQIQNEIEERRRLERRPLSDKLKNKVENDVVNSIDNARKELEHLHQTGRANQFYKGLHKSILRTGNQTRNNMGTTINKVVKKLDGKLRENKYSMNNNSTPQNVLNRKKRVEKTRNHLKKALKNINPHKKTGVTSHTRFKGMGGSKTTKQVKGRRVLKNGAVGGYVKQKDGSWRWSFLKRD